MLSAWPLLSSGFDPVWALQGLHLVGLRTEGRSSFRSNQVGTVEDSFLCSLLEQPFSDF